MSDAPSNPSTALVPVASTEMPGEKTASKVVVPMSHPDMRRQIASLEAQIAFMKRVLGKVPRKDRRNFIRTATDMAIDETNGKFDPQLELSISLLRVQWPNDSNQRAATMVTSIELMARRPHTKTELGHLWETLQEMRP